ncbi:MAG: hypothetical protein V1824_04660 [archaeon]
MDTVILKNLPLDIRVLILKELGYNTDGIYVVDSNNNKVIDKYISEPVKIDNMIILPGSTIILDDNPVSIACYLDEYPIDEI